MIMSRRPARSPLLAKLLKRHTHESIKWFRPSPQREKNISKEKKNERRVADQELALRDFAATLATLAADRWLLIFLRSDRRQEEGQELKIDHRFISFGGAEGGGGGVGGAATAGAADRWNKRNSWQKRQIHWFVLKSIRVQRSDDWTTFCGRFNWLVTSRVDRFKESTSILGASRSSRPEYAGHGGGWNGRRNSDEFGTVARSRLLADGGIRSE